MVGSTIGAVFMLRYAVMVGSAIGAVFMLRFAVMVGCTTVLFSC